MEAITTREVNGYTVEVHYDEDPSSPREWDNVGSFITRSSAYAIDGISIHVDYWYSDPETFLRETKDAFEARVALPLRGGDGSDFYVCDADDPFTAVYLDTPHGVSTCMGDDATDEQIENALRAELETYNQWARGEVYGFVVKDANGEIGESVWGFYDEDDAMAEGVALAECSERSKPTPTLKERVGGLIAEYEQGREANPFAGVSYDNVLRDLRDIIS